MEMTGLDETKEKILEVAVVITNTKLEKLDEFHHVVYQSKEVLDGMDEWCKTTHGRSGLTKEVAAGMPLDRVEEELVAFGKKHFGEDKIVLCGNSVGQDRKFIDRYMPKLASLLHYRLIDVSSFKEVFRNCYGIVFKKSEDRHRAKDDIYESIAELANCLKYVKID